MKIDLSQMHQNMLTIAFRLLDEATEVNPNFSNAKNRYHYQLRYRPDDFSGETK